MSSEREVFLKDLLKRWPRQYVGCSLMSTRENSLFSVVGVGRGIPLHTKPLFHTLQNS